MSLGSILKKLKIIPTQDIRVETGEDGTRLYLANDPALSSTPSVSSPSSDFSTPWELQLSGSNIISKNAIAYWYGEQVLLATENSPLTWTAPALGASLYVDVSYSSGWSCVAATAAGSTAGHQYYLVGKYESDGSITQYQHGILRITDRYQ